MRLDFVVVSQNIKQKVKGTNQFGDNGIGLF